MGGYNQGQNEQIDKALDLWPKICELIKQDYRKKLVLVNVLVF